MENTLSTSWTYQRLLELFQQNKKLLVATHPADMDQDVTIWIKLESASFITNSLTMLIRGSNQRNTAKMANGAGDLIVPLCIKKGHGVTCAISIFIIRCVWTHT